MREREKNPWKQINYTNSSGKCNTKKLKVENGDPFMHTAVSNVSNTENSIAHTHTAFYVGLFNRERCENTHYFYATVLYFQFPVPIYGEHRAYQHNVYKYDILTQAMWISFVMCMYIREVAAHEYQVNEIVFTHTAQWISFMKVYKQ